MTESKLVIISLLIAPIFTTGIAMSGIQNAHAVVPTDPVVLKIENLIDQVNDLNDPDLNDGNKKSLTQKLENSLKNLQKFEDEKACEKLFSFIDQLEAFVKAGKLEQGQVQNMIDQAFLCILALCTD